MTVVSRTGAAPRQATVEDALWTLYDLAGQVRDPTGRAPFQRLSLESALSLLADARPEEVTVTSRRAALAALASANGGQLPRFEELKDLYDRYVRQLVPETPLDRRDAALRSQTEQIIQEEMASWIQDICAIEQVVADDQHDALWIFSEFETVESLDHLERWVRPENWPRWGPVLFKSMSPLGELTVVPTAGGEQTHGNYMEVVSLLGRELQTVLRCDFKRAPGWVGMSYDLDHSVGNALNVDRGFLLATELANGNVVVKALKVVGFTDPSWNDVSRSVCCPMWTDFVRQSTRNAATARRGSRPGALEVIGAAPRTEAAPSSEQAGSPDEAARVVASDLSDHWVQSVTEAASTYSEYARDVGSRLWSGIYGRGDAARDSSRLFLLLARDWARACQAGVEIANTVANIDVAPGAGPGTGPGTGVGTGPDRRTREFTTVSVSAPPSPLPVTLTDLVHVDIDGATLPSLDLKLTPTRVDPTPDPANVHIDLDTTPFPVGLYEGSVLLGTGPAQQRGAAHVYVCKARLAP